MTSWSLIRHRVFLSCHCASSRSRTQLHCRYFANAPWSAIQTSRLPVPDPSPTQNHRSATGIPALLKSNAANEDAAEWTPLSESRRLAFKSSPWTRSFGGLDFDDVFAKRRLPTTLYPEHATNGKRWVEAAVHKINSAGRYRWGDISIETLQQRWPSMMFYCLSHSPQLSLHLLSNGPEWPFRSFGMTMDCLLYLKRSYWDYINTNPELLKLFLELLHSQRDPRNWPDHHMRVRHLDLFLEHASKDEGQHLLVDFKHTYALTQQSCILRFADFFSTFGDIEQALNMLSLVLPHRLAEPSARVRISCLKLLMLDYVEKDASSQNFHIVPRLLQMGVKPELAIHNIIIKNSFKAGMSQVGWDVFRFMKEAKLPTNERTYLALLQDAFQNRDVEHLEEVFTAIHEDPDLRRHPHIIACTLHIIRLISASDRSNNPRRTFSHMLAVYGRAFNAAPLQRLGMISDADVPPENSMLPEPDARTLALTVGSFVLIQTSPQVVRELWSRFWQLVNTGDPVALAAAKEDILHNTLIRFHGDKQHANLARCRAIVHRMLTDNRTCWPSPRTWGTLIVAHLAHADHRGAEQIYKLMEERGEKLDEKTRELVRGRYPHTLMAERARGAIQRSDAEFEEYPDDEVELGEVANQEKMADQSMAEPGDHNAADEEDISWQTLIDAALKNARGWKEQ